MGIATDFDRIVLTGIITAGAKETFQQQFQTLLILLKTSVNPKLKLLSISAEQIFNARELKCIRFTPYDETLDSNFVLQQKDSILYSHATLSNQLFLAPYKSDWGSK